MSRLCRDRRKFPSKSPRGACGVLGREGENTEPTATLASLAVGRESLPHSFSCAALTTTRRYFTVSRLAWNHLRTGSAGGEVPRRHLGRTAPRNELALCPWPRPLLTGPRTRESLPPPAPPPPPMPIYLDWNATTPVYPEVAAAARPWLDDPELFGNPSSSHRYGAAPRAAVAAARASVASLVGASDPAEIVFASCGTEADGWVVWGATMAARRRARASSPLPHVVATSVEHPAVLATLDRRENERFGREGKSGASRGGGPHYRPRQYWSRPAPSRSGSRR